MAKEKVTILHRWFDEVWNKGRTEVIDEMIAPECVAHDIEATGKPIAFEGTLMFRVRDGKVVEARNSFDFLKMFQQMGAG